MARKLIRIAIVPLVFLVLVAFGGANGQVPAPSVELPPRSPEPANQSIEKPTPAPSVDQLVSKLESLRAQKAEIEKQEKLVAEELKKRFAELQERLAKLGVLPAALPIAEPPLQVFPGSAPRIPK